MGSAFQEDVKQLKNIQKKSMIDHKWRYHKQCGKSCQKLLRYPDFQYIKGCCKGNEINCQRSNGSKLTGKIQIRQKENLFNGKNNEVLE